MQLGTFSNSIYTLCTWFYRLAYVNVLWILFTILGLGIFGLFPATIAMLATLRQYINKKDVPVYSTFWKYYKDEFVKSNKLGAVIMLIAIILYINTQFIKTTDLSISEFMTVTSIIMSCFYFLVICYLLASYVEFDLNVKTHIKNSILIAMYNPLPSLYIIFGFAAVYYALTYISGLGFFFSVSILGLVVLSSAKLAYRKIEKKQTALPT
ncbi:YesL family protein [Gracilibacillus kekensis]|uniref:Uncharacterized membrane protein YesL n=1 Tax=Gracilibacillus kekensis TaxID=1027249 RepID=A0A1M7PXQ9_9BACI|nr:DUF624 domain-containing protein [Gracilibacillus kekensis]SHN22425.1 Uncharacterized membrane protein YesL [Gracilibacillus kekensis]